MLVCHFSDGLKSEDGFLNRAVNIFLGKGLGGGGKNGYLFDTELNGGFHAFGVGNKTRVGYSWLFVDLLKQFLGVGHLGDPFR
jgi:hypothetical protein